MITNKKVKQKQLLWIIIAIILVLLLITKYWGIISFSYTNLILKKKDGYVLCLDQDTEIMLDGLLGTIDISEDGKKGIFFRETQTGQIEIAEIDLENARIYVLIMAEELEKAMNAIGKSEYTGKAEERPKSIKYAKEESAVNFIWNDSLYQLDLNKNQMTCIIENLGQTKLALEGRDYEWIDENNLVYATVDEQGINSIMKYNLQTQEKSFIHYGTGVCLIEGEKIICYHRYIKDSTTWVHYHEFVIIDLNSFEIEESYTLKREAIFRVMGEVVFGQEANSQIIWSERGSNCLYVYDYEKDRFVKKRILGKKIYSYVNVPN